MEENKEETLEQAEVTAEDKSNSTPQTEMEALQKSYKELQGAFTKKSQAVKELEQKINSMPNRDEIIREYLLSVNKGGKPPLLTSSSSAFDFAKDVKPASLAAADRLAREYFEKGV